jgi:hypothetical protein
LTAGFEAARAAPRTTRRVTDRGQVRLRQMDAWREKRVRSMDYTHLAVMRRAEAKLMRRKELYRRAEAAEKCAATLHGPCRPLRRQSAY